MIGSWFLLRVLIGLSIVTVLFLSQRFWYRALWRVTGHWGRTTLRVGVRLLYLSGWLLVIATLADNIRQDHGRLLPNQSPGALTSLADAAALAILPGTSDGLAADALLDVLRISDL